MRFLHTADWHLGRSLCGARLLAEQSQVLHRLVDLAREASVDAVLVAGDVYDRAVAPAEAMALYEELITRLCEESGAPLVLIAGNHDSGERLAHLSRFLCRGGLHLYGRLTAAIEPLELRDEAGPVLIYPIPFADPAEVREIHPGSGAADCQEAMQAVMESIVAGLPRGVRCIGIGHAYVAGGVVSESNRPLCIGGSELVDAGLFDPFCYMAAGHLHRPQSLRGGRVQYPGSPYRYSFSETEHAKGCLLVEIDAAGRVQSEFHPLMAERQVETRRGLLRDLLEGPGSSDYLKITLLDALPVLDAAQQLRERFPNLLQIGQESLSGPAGEMPDSASMDLTHLDPLFREFYRHARGSELEPAGAALLQRCLARLDLRRREARAPGLLFEDEV